MKRSLVVVPAVLLGLAISFACGGDSTNGNNPPPGGDSVALQPVVTNGLSFPLFLTAPSGDLSRLFVIEKDGRIRIIKNGTLLSTPFLDITAKTSKGSEQGLLGMAFYPDYGASGRFIVSYTSPQGTLSGGTSVISRFQVSANADIADTTEKVLLTLDQPYDNHNGGMIAFGKDGYLYAGYGDGGSGGDPDGHGQNRMDLLGSLLRLDVAGSGAYTIPPTNPWAGSLSIANELWNYGLRNPWRFSFDRLTGDLYIADVGQGALEEIDVQPAASTGGENYGWNTMEGLSCYGAATCNQTGLTLPVLDYPHAGGACAVTGGYVYRGSAIPSLQGVYFYSDYCSGWVHSLKYVGGLATDPRDWPTLATGGGVPSFGEDAAGELYVLTASGTVYRVVPQP